MPAADILTINVTFDPSVRTISLSDTNRYGGATIDSNSIRISISGIVPVGTDFTARLDFAVPIENTRHEVYKPFVLLEQDDEIWSAIVPQSVLMAAKETRKLPFQLVLRHGDTIINSRNTIILEITRAINADNSVIDVYAPYIMYRDDSWAWVSDFTYKTGSVVTYDGEIYISKIDGNIGHQPSPTGNSPYWDWLEDLPDERTPGQMIVVDANEQAYWQTVSSKAIVHTTGNSPYTITHSLDAPVTCTFYQVNGSIAEQIDIAYTQTEHTVTLETTHNMADILVVMTSLPGLFIDPGVSPQF